MTEEWKPIPGWEMYEVSDAGRVRSLHHFVPKLLRQATLPSGHKYVRMVRGDGSKQQHILVHRAVALAFIGPQPFEKAEVRHKDGDPANNRKGNLSWSTRRRNNQDRKWHGGNRYHRVTPRMVREIRTRPETGRALAQEYGLSEGLVSMIRNRRIHEDVA